MSRRSAGRRHDRQVGTTGHEWDGIQELNTPLPRWWLWLFYATIVWAVGYWIVYPAWPLLSSYTGGACQLACARGGRQPISPRCKAQRAADDGEARQRRRCSRSRRRRNCSISPARWAVAPSPTIARRVMAPAAAAPRAIRISPTTTGCGAASSTDISQTITHGARSGDDQGPSGQHAGVRPRRHAQARRTSSPVADYVRSLSGLPTDAGADLARGARSSPTIAPPAMAPTARATARVGAPNLTDQIWLYGPDKATIIDGIANGHGGVMPAWGGKLDPVTIKALDGLRPHVRRRGVTAPWPGWCNRRPPWKACRRASRSSRSASGCAACDDRLPRPMPDTPPMTTSRSMRRARKIYPQQRRRHLSAASNGLVLSVTLGIYYLLPFVRWDRGPNAPEPGGAARFPGRRFYFFFIEIWPQEVYYLTGLLILAAMALFLMNAVAGRVWCGYLCPQTVWTDLFLGDRALDRGRSPRAYAARPAARGTSSAWRARRPSIFCGS